MANRAHPRRVMREDSGESLVEFAIAGMLFLTGLFGIIDCARAMYTYHFVAYAAQEGTRYAMVRGNDWSGACASANSTACAATSAQVTAFVQGLATPGISGTSIVATPSWPQLNVDGSATGCSTSATQNSKGCLVKVQVSYPFHFLLLPFLHLNTLTMTATSEQVISY